MFVIMNYTGLDINSFPILKAAITDKNRNKYGFNIVFSDENKKPLISWNEWHTEKQNDKDIINMFKPVHTNYGYLSGFNNLVIVDFDAEWIYYEALEYFKDKMNTFTVKTPNNGYHSYFITKYPKGYDFYKNTLKVEILGKKYGIVCGKAKNREGKLVEYVIENNRPILKDDNIIGNMKDFLDKTLTKFDFLSYKCIHSTLSGKVNHLEHEQRLDISNLFLQNGASIKTTSNFFKMCSDFNMDITQYYVKRDLDKIENRDLKHPTCESLAEHFKFDRQYCKGCTRLKDPAPESGNKSHDSFKFNLKYPTNHLRHFEELKVSTSLFGEEYTPIFKSLWYSLVSYRLRDKKIEIGKLKTDCRISILFVIPSGRGKGELKRVIKKFVSLSSGECSEPTSLHAEQLVGKVVPLPRKKGNKETNGAEKDFNEFVERLGYLADDFVVIDEAYNLLTSNQLHYSEARKYMRTALDPYPNNEIHKRTTELGRDAALNYKPICLVGMFVQPIPFENDILILEGDIRRFIVSYVNMQGIDISGALKDRILSNEEDGVAINSFSKYVNGLGDFSSFTLTDAAKSKFIELSDDLVKRGKSYSNKVRNFIESFAFTIQNYLLKFSVVQTFQEDKNEISVKHVELAYIDLFELLDHMYQFVHEKIPGNLHYGNNWKGARSKDQETLTWLYNQAAFTEANSNVSIKQYKCRIMEIYNVKERRAADILKSHRESGWVEDKQQFQDSKIWLTKSLKASMDAMFASLQPIQKRDFQYYKLIEKYDTY